MFNFGICKKYFQQMYNKYTNYAIKWINTTSMTYDTCVIQLPFMHMCFSDDSFILNFLK